jgi:1-acyl-sn-glycerol-3-phosphate acyltransferase
MSGWASRILRLEVVVSGPLPGPGVCVANHLGYADVFALGSVLPRAAFVAKRDVRTWPVVGWLAAMGGTVFVDRVEARHLGAALAEIERLLAEGITVVVFAEGTSSDGSKVLPFRSSLLAAGARQRCPAVPVAIAYRDLEGRPNRALAYHGDDVFVPHLVDALAAQPSRVQLAFGQPVRAGDRKELARHLRASILSALGGPEAG